MATLKAVEGPNPSDSFPPDYVPPSQYPSYPIQPYTGAVASAEFSSADRNKDSGLSKEEWYRKYGAQEGFEIADATGDGSVSLGENINQG